MADPEQPRELEDAGDTSAPDRAGKDARTPEATPPAATGTPLTQQLGRVVMLVAAVLFGVFAVANFDQVRFNYVFGEADVPLFVLLIVSFALGALIAWIATLRSERRKRR